MDKEIDPEHSSIVLNMFTRELETKTSSCLLAIAEGWH